MHKEFYQSIQQTLQLQNKNKNEQGICKDRKKRLNLTNNLKNQFLGQYILKIRTV